MEGTHIREARLACLSDGMPDAEAEEHLRWCARCRSGLADYRWLHRELTATLAAVAGGVVVPRANWRAVRERSRAAERRQVAGWRLSVLASIALAVCSMLFVPVLLDASVALAQASRPEVVGIPTPDGAIVSGAPALLAATPTPDLAREGTASPPTPVFELLPTPAEPGA